MQVKAFCAFALPGLCALSRQFVIERQSRAKRESVPRQSLATRRLHSQQRPLSSADAPSLSLLFGSCLGELLLDITAFLARSSWTGQ